MIQMPELLVRLARIPLPNEATRKVLTVMCVSAEGNDVPLCPLTEREISNASGVPSPLVGRALRWLEDCSLVEPDCYPWEGAPEYWLNWELIETLSSGWESKHPFRA